MKRIFYEKIEENYDLLNQAMPEYAKFQEKIKNPLKELAEQKRTRLFAVELGAGTGITTKKILETDEKVFLISIENEPVMARQFRQNINGTLKERVHLVEKEGVEYLKRLKENTFDCFISCQTIHNLDGNHREQLLHEVYRTLKSEGWFINLDKYAVSNKKEHEKQVRKRIKDYKEGFDRLGQSKLAEYWVKQLQQNNKPEFLMKEKDAKKRMGDIGFRRVKTLERNGLEALVIAIK